MSEFHIEKDPTTGKRSVIFVSNIWFFFMFFVTLIGILAAMAIPKLMKAMDEVKMAKQATGNIASDTGGLSNSADTMAESNLK